MNFSHIAFRNIFRSPRRSIMTAAVIAFGAFTTILMIATLDGSHEKLVENMVRLETGYLRIHARGYHEHKTLEYLIADPQAVYDLLDTDPQVIGYAPRLEGFALLSYQEQSVGARIVGIDPEREATVSFLSKKVVAGKMLVSQAPSEILVGVEMARNLEVGLGDKLVLLTWGADGSTGYGLYTVGGIIRANSAEIDNYSAFLNIAELDTVLSARGGVTQIPVNIKEVHKLPEIVARLSAALPQGAYEVLSWQELLPAIVEFIELDNAGGYVVLSVLLVVVACGILNTILLATFERFHEFGVMMALGTKPYQIGGLIMLESFLLCLGGTLVGALAGFGFSYYLYLNPWYLPGYAEAFALYGMEPYIFAKVYPATVWGMSLLILGLGIVATIYPAIHAARTRPIKALRAI